MMRWGNCVRHARSRTGHPLLHLGLAALLLGAAGGAEASGPALADLRHTRWTLGDGAPGNIRAITQGRDGFLWLGTSTGLYRFDGITFERVLPADEQRRRSLQVTALLAARNGDIWVGYDSGGIGVVRMGILRNANPWTPDGGIDAIVQARDGSIWVTGDSRGVLLISRLKNGRWARIGPEHGYQPGEMGPIMAASDGSIYVSAPPAVLRMRAGADQFEKLPHSAAPYGTFAEQPDGTVWLADDTGLRRLDGSGKRVPITGANTPFARRAMRSDHHGNLWLLAQDDGLTRLRPTSSGAGPAEHMTADQGLTSSLSLSAFEDREGNFWVGTASGLDRFTPTNVTLSSVREGIVTGFVRSRSGSRLFVAGLSGIYRIDAGRTEPTLIFRKASIGVLCGDDRRLLTFSLEGHYLLDLSSAGATARVRKIGNPLSISCMLDEHGRFWTGRDRLYQLVGSKLVPAAGTSGEKKGTVVKLRSDLRGGVIFSRPSTGFRRRVGTTESALWPRTAPAIGAISTLWSSNRTILAGAEAGIGRWDGRRFSNLRQRDYPFLADITGILPDADGSTWLIGVDGIVRAPTRALHKAFDQPGTPIPIERFGYYEGFAARSYMNEANDVAQDASGRIWFATNKGLAYVDPANIARNALPPPVTIRSLTAAGRNWTVADGRIRLPAGTDRLQIDYTGLSLTDAKANRFRYRLEGADTAWTDAEGRRQALYTNLGPGTYHFRVLAANNDGVWNKDGAVLSFEIAPRFYQTIWFAMLCALGAGGLLWLLYRQRLRIIADRTRAGFEAQLSERERIARELHDTLLQGFQGLVLRLQAVAERLPRGGDARVALEGALDRADDVLLEGRDRVRALRETMEPVMLRPRLSALAGEILPDDIHVAIGENGRSRPVCAPVADEIAAIVAEALANTARHAHAAQVQVRIIHGLDRLTVTLRDDGIGLPAAVLAAGHRDGHFGLVGMRERATRLSGTLSITSNPDDGTHVTLVVPARLAYG